MKANIYFAKLHFSRGISKTIYLKFSDHGILELRFKKIPFAKSFHNDHPIAVEAKQQLEEYFEGERKEFTCPLVLQGTQFQKSAWKVLRSIPYGKALSYKDQALKMNNPKAVRAVGGANGKNPIPIIVPCHRVLQKSGDLGGFSAGLSYKRKLLNLEGITFN